MPSRTPIVIRSSEHYLDWVYAVVSQIPKGKVTTYGLIADCLALGSARMVGWALHQLPPDSDLPAHRVINRQGILTGRHHFDPPAAMEERLRAEGLSVVDNKVQHMSKHLWRPSEHFAQIAPDI